MDPNSPRPQMPEQPRYQVPTQTLDPNYLDQIAAPIQQKTISPIILFGGIGAFILVLIIGFFAILNSGGPNLTERIDSFAYRVQALDKLSEDNAKTIQSSNLRALNSSMNTILTGVNTAVQTSLGEEQSTSAPEDSPVSIEYVALAKKLDDARLNVIFDRVYAREVAYQLNTLRAEMNYIYDGIKAENFRSELEKADADIEKLSEDFSQFKE